MQKLDQTPTNPKLCCSSSMNVFNAQKFMFWKMIFKAWCGIWNLSNKFKRHHGYIKMIEIRKLLVALINLYLVLMFITFSI